MYTYSGDFYEVEMIKRTKNKIKLSKLSIFFYKLLKSVNWDKYEYE